MPLDNDYSDERLRALVSEERVHRAVYIDREIFELEMERIFGRAWLYVAHESQIPNPGDFVTTHIGRQPIVVCRHTDGKVYALYNRCGHRGAVVQNEECGNVKRFRCLYHGWLYETNGDLAAVPLADGYGPEFDRTDPKNGMVRLAEVDSYRGFVFARQKAGGIGLLDWLGDAKDAIDEVVDRSPVGEVEVTGGCHRYIYHGNWKLQAENLADQYHAAFSHESSTTPDGYQFTRRPGEKGTRIKVLGADGQPGQEAKGQWAFPGGHNAGGALTTDGEQSGVVFDRYRQMMVEAYGAERAKEIIDHKRHSAYFYPNFDLHMLAQAVRVIRPIDVNLTEVVIYPVKLKGAPDEMFADTVRLLNISHSASSLGQTDDVEAFERSQRGLETQGNDWLIFLRGLNQDVPDGERGGFRGPQYSENGMRFQHRAWLDYMLGQV
jgi:phenylpropionate dioxygenase-like ring-hydroxylating dioxygenase large terminal subunit